MTIRRDDFIAGFQSLYGVSELEADRALRDVELAYAEQQNAELQQALDTTDGEHLKQISEWKSHEAAARGFAMELAQMQGQSGPVLGLIQAGEYAKALSAIRTAEEQQPGIH